MLFVFYGEEEEDRKSHILLRRRSGNKSFYSEDEVGWVGGWGRGEWTGGVGGGGGQGEGGKRGREGERRSNSLPGPYNLRIPVIEGTV